VAQLPGRSLDDISRHEDWVKCLKSISDRKKLQLQRMDPRFTECLQSARSHLQSLRSKIAEERLVNEERERHELARYVITPLSPHPHPDCPSAGGSRAELHKALHLQRAKKIEELEMKLTANEELKRQADAERQREEERRQQEVKQTKALAEQYKEERRKYLEAQREAARVREEEEMRERKLQQELAMPKIAHREELRRQKLDEMRRKEVSLPHLPSLLTLHPAGDLAR
jgi:hypothetical protein